MSAALNWKAVLLMKRLLIAQKSKRCCALLFRSPLLFVTGMLFDLFPTLAFQFPVKNTSDFFELIQNSADIVADVLECKNMIFDKLAR